MPFLEKHNYSQATALYGNEFNGFMGCVLAWPRDRYEVEAVDTSRIARTVHPGAPIQSKATCRLCRR